MEIDQHKQNEALEKARQILKENEQRRSAVRLEKFFRDVVAGDVTVLENDEHVHNLASFMYFLHEDGDDDQIFIALEKLGYGACHSEVKVRERSIMVLSVFIGMTMKNDDDTFVEALSKILVSWLKEEDKYIAGFEFVCSQFQQLVQKLLENEQWYEVEELIVVLYQIHGGILDKPNVIKRVVAKIQSQLAHDDTLDKLLNIYLDSYNPKRDIAESILVHLGHRAISFIIDTLASEDNRERRFMLIELIPANPKTYDLVEDLLGNNPPWYVVRNSILILSREDLPRLFEMIKPYTTHSDMRVQQQVVNAVWKMGGSQLLERLLYILENINDELKASLVTQLGQMTGDQDVGLAFVQLLSQRNSFSRIVKDELVLSLCQNLAFFPSLDTSSCLNELLDERLQTKDLKDRIVVAIKESLTILGETKGAIKKKSLDVGDSDFALDLDFLNGDLGVTEEPESLNLDVLEEDEDLEEEEDDAFLAIMAETQSAFGEEQSFGVDHHVSIWSDLYDSLDTKTFDAFFGLLESRQFVAGEVLVYRDSLEQVIFFIDSGDVDVVASDDAEEMSLKNLQSGDLAGAGSFFNHSLWPFALVAQEKVLAHTLDIDKFENFLIQNPEAANAFQRFCESRDVVTKLLDMLSVTEPLSSNVKISSMNKQLRCFDSASEEVVIGECYGAHRGGVCLEIPIVPGSLKKELAGLLVELVLCDEDDSCEKSFGVVVGWKRIVGSDERVKLLVKFYHQNRTELFNCLSLTFL